MKHLGLALAALLAAGSASGMERGALATGDRYASGGIGRDEIAELVAERGSYTLWIITAANKTGAHLADAHVRISRESGAILFDKAIPGPWLLADLPPGSYTIVATYGREKRQSKATIRTRADRRQSIFYFDVPAQVLPPGAQQ